MAESIKSSRDRGGLMRGRTYESAARHFPYALND